MRGKLFLIGCLLLTVILAACHYRIAETVVPTEGREGADSLVTDSCLYSAGMMNWWWLKYPFTAKTRSANGG